MSVPAVARFALPTILLSHAAPVLAQAAAPPPGEGLSWARLVAPLLFSLVLAGAAAFLLRARLKGALLPLNRGQRRLRLLETLRISHQTDLYLLDLDGRELLVAASASGASLLLDRGEKVD